VAFSLAAFAFSTAAAPYYFSQKIMPSKNLFVFIGEKAIQICMLKDSRRNKRIEDSLFSTAYFAFMIIKLILRHGGGKE
jgi:hypothetical protein